MDDRFVTSIPPSSMKPVPLQFEPGYQIDGSPLEANRYSEGLWNRFNTRGKPRKMGGYDLITYNASGPVFGSWIYTANGTAFIYSGSASGMEMQPVTLAGAVAGAKSNLTLSGYSANSGNIWLIDSIYDPSGANDIIVAHAGRNLFAIDSTVTSQPMFGYAGSSSAMVTMSNAPSVAGGVMVAHPFVMSFDSNGGVAWSDAGLPLTWSGGSSGSARVTETKIVCGRQARGGAGQAPAGLLWSMNAVTRFTYVGGTPVFNFDQIAGDTSILSSRSPVDFDGVFYWPSTDRFLAYTGVIKEVKNDQNLDWFYSNINMAARQSVFGFKVPRWGEIWWCFPFGNSTTPDYAIIYNVRLGVWYNTKLPETGRTDGLFSNIMRFPILFGSQSSANLYPIWLHEAIIGGVESHDKTAQGVTTAIPASYTTGFITLEDSGIEKNISLMRIEPGFNQQGDMAVTRIGRPFANGQDVSGSRVTFTSGQSTVDDIRGEERFLRLIFDSNVAGGFYEYAKSYIHLRPGASRPKGA